MTVKDQQDLLQTAPFQMTLQYENEHVKNNNKCDDDAEMINHEFINFDIAENQFQG